MTSGRERLVALAGVLVAWMLLSWLLYSPRLALFPPPWAVAVRFVELGRERLPADVWASLREATGGWAMGSAAAMVIGMLIGRVRPARLLLRPPIDFLRFISPLAWVPLCILWFGIGYASKAAIIFLISFFTVVVNTAHGMASVEPDTLKAGRTLHLRPLQHLEVLVFSALPDILTGLRYALGAAWGGVVVSELVAGNTGLGALEAYGGQSFDVAQIMVGMLVIAALGYLANAAFVALQRRLFPWIVANRPGRVT